MKYVIFENPTTGYFVPLVFGDEIIHRIAAIGVLRHQPELKLLSAGHCAYIERTEDGLTYAGWECYGESESLKVESREEEDTLIIRFFMRHGLAGLDLQNYLLYVSMQKYRTSDNGK